MVTLIDRLRKVENRRQKWEVTRYRKPTDRLPSPTLIKMLSLRGLEIVVQDWTDIATGVLADKLSGDPDRDAILDILIGHSADEDKHDKQLDLLAEYWGITGNVSTDAYLLIREWIYLDSDPLVKKLVIESMVFFQILAVLAMETDDQYTQIIRQWIMFDEAAHVASARILVKYMGLQIDRATLDLAIRTLEWMLGDLPTSEIERYKKIANQVLTKGVTDLAATNSTVTVQDFFTQVDNRDILYAS